LKEANVSSEDELHVSVEDHRYEEYVPTKQKKKVFGGSGHLLGRYSFVLHLTFKLLIYLLYNL
jgi:hypothetical protein